MATARSSQAPPPSDDGSAKLGDRLLSSRAVRAMTGDSSRRKIRHWVERGEFNCYALDGKTVYSERESSTSLSESRLEDLRGHPGGAAGARPLNAPVTPQAMKPSRVNSLRASKLLMRFGSGGRI